MNTKHLSELQEHLKRECGARVQALVCDYGELTVEIAAASLLGVAEILRDHPDFRFDTLIDLCAVDYLEYGRSEWTTESASTTGFSRAVHEEAPSEKSWSKPRFAVVYHLLSVNLNHRLRLKVFCGEEHPEVDSVVSIWRAADWYEREAYDLYGVVFKGHPDLRRLLTDYGFVGHPFRKDFPLTGKVEVRYDADTQSVVYDPVDIEPRVLVPKVIRYPTKESDHG